MQYPQGITAPQLVSEICGIHNRLQHEANQFRHNTRWTYPRANWNAMQYSAEHQTTAVVYLNTLGDCVACDLSAYTSGQIVATYTNGARVPRPPYCAIPGTNRDAYIGAQRAMFGAARAAGLDTDDREGMLDAINGLLNTELTSRTQMIPAEMEFVTVAIEAGYILPGWRPNRAADIRVLLRAA